ncbi:MAG: hypothetical protein KKF77_11355 [Proteobacteria bacterium]|nr:hypothetical protein [Pseudomonadota bacterium]
MKIPLGIDDKDKQQVFLDYLNAVIREKAQSTQGTAGVRDDGIFEATTKGIFDIEGNLTSAKVSVVHSSSGTLDYVEIETEDEEDSGTIISTLSKLVTEVLVATLRAKRKQFYQSVSFCYTGPHLGGEYWLPTFRFAPSIPQDEGPDMINVERYVQFDMTINAIDRMDAIRLAQAAASRHAARLSLLMDVGLYAPKHQFLWVLPSNTDPSEIKSVRLQTGLIGHTQPRSQMPKKGELCALGEYHGLLSDRFHRLGTLQSPPKETKKILNYFNKAPASMVECFDSCARLYQVALVVGAQYPSLGLAYRVAAVESLSYSESACNGFSNFVRKYVDGTQETETVIKYLYEKCRSAHFHSGSFPMGEYAPSKIFNSIMDPDQIWIAKVQWKGSAILRKAIVNWIYAVALGGRTETNK